jgi:hypothetical protein
MHTLRSVCTPHYLVSFHTETRDLNLRNIRSEVCILRMFHAKGSLEVVAISWIKYNFSPVAQNSNASVCSRILRPHREWRGLTVEWRGDQNIKIIFTRARFYILSEFCVSQDIQSGFVAYNNLSLMQSCLTPDRPHILNTL